MRRSIRRLVVSSTAIAVAALGLGAAPSGASTPTGPVAPAPVRRILGADPITANVFTAWEYLVANTTLTRVQIAGLEGNLLYESGGALNPAQVEFGCQVPPGPCGAGIAQWTDPGTRFNGLVALATSKHVSWTNLEVQLQYVEQELTHDSSFGLASLKACTTVSCATLVVETKYERPADQSTSCSDPNASFCMRLADANEIYSAYGTPKSGYWMLGANGTVYGFGSAGKLGSEPGFAVAIATRADGRGYWVVDGAGKVSHFGAAADHGNPPALRAGEVVSTISATPSGNGYWLFTNRGAPSRTATPISTATCRRAR